MTDEGYLKSEARFTKVGVQEYDKSKITGDPKDSGEIVNIYRPAETVFAAETQESIKLKPVTMHHRTEKVNAENFKTYSVGYVGENIYKFDDEHLAGSIQITDKNAIEAVKNGYFNQISLGYETEIKKEKGVYNDSSYEYIFDGPMKVNHCAIVSSGRCGSTVAIMDEKDVKEEKGEKKMTEENKKVDLADTDAKEDQKKQAEKEIKDVVINDAGIEEKINEKVSKRLLLLDKAQFFKNRDELINLPNRKILELCLQDTVENINDKSDDYLVGFIDATYSGHKKSIEEYQAINDSSIGCGSASKVYTAHEIKKLKN
jgi:hypothetical protein